MPIIMLTAKDDEIDKVLGLGDGADDYIRPFSVREFRSRVKAALRAARMMCSGPTRPPASRSSRGRSRSISDRRGCDGRGPWCSSHLRRVRDLAALAADSGRVHTREMLLERVWDLSTAIRAR